LDSGNRAHFPSLGGFEGKNQNQNVTSGISGQQEEQQDFPKVTFILDGI
jgi:hypothetical protein